MKRWYDDVPEQTYPDDSLADYRRAIRGEDPTDHFLIAMDGRPIGMIQSYRVDDHPAYVAQVSLGRPAIGIDLFIGEPDLVGRGHGPTLIRTFLRDVAFPRYGIDLCVIGPSRSNGSAIRAYEKAGFRFLKIYREPDAREPEHYLMALPRGELDAGTM